MSVNVVEPVGNSVTLRLGAGARRKTRQALQLLRLDQAVAVRRVLGVGAPLRDLVARRRDRARRRRERDQQRRERGAGHDQARDHPIRPDVGELGLAAYSLRGIRPARNASRPATTARLHRVRHPHRVVRVGDRRVHQHAGAAQLHRDRRIRCRADAGIDQHRDLRALEDELQVPRIENAHTRADQRCERHDRDAADRLELARDDRIVRRVDHHVETVGDQRLRGLERLPDVGEQRVLVAEHLEFAQRVAVEQFAARASACAPLRRRCSSRRCWAGR